MRLHPRWGRARAARRPLSLEQLESRDMMAGTATAPLLLDATNLNAGRPQRPTPSPLIEARSYDGSGNNLSNTDWGSTNEKLLRMTAAAYADGIAKPAGANRLSARAISNAL